MKPMERRTTYFVNRDVQGKIVIRVVLYWLACIAAVVGLLAVAPMAVASFYGANVDFGGILIHLWVKFWPVGCASLLVLPIVIVDSIRMSHRFVGPLLRIGNDMQRLVDGEEVPPVELRQHDAWAELAEAFNKLSAEVQTLRAEKAATLKSNDESPADTEAMKTAP